MLSRRQWLLGMLMVGLAPGRGHTDPVAWAADYQVKIGLLYVLTFGMTGVLEQEVDHTAGTYRVRLVGEGSGVRNRFESAGVVRQGRFSPRTTFAYHTIRGREHQTRVVYDDDRRVVQYDHRSETFLLGRIRSGRNSFAVPEGLAVDDFATVIMNHGAGLFEAAGKAYRVFIVRRAQRPGEGVDEVQAGGARGEIVPLDVSFIKDPDGPGTVSLVDFSTLSSWSKASDPMRFTFAADRRIARTDGRFILGTSVQVTFQPRS
jgi:hypothetical protein